MTIYEQQNLKILGSSLLKIHTKNSVIFKKIYDTAHDIESHLYSSKF